MFTAPRVQDLVQRDLARAVSGDAGAGAADIVTRRDQHHTVLGQVGERGPQHIVGADRVDGERVHPGGHVGVLDLGEGHDGAGEHHGVEAAERFGRIADDLVDRGRVLDVQFERGAANGVGQLGQQVHPSCGYRHLGAECGGTLGDRVADAGGGADHEEA